MATERSRLLVLGALAVVLVVVIGRMLMAPSAAPSAALSAASNGAGRPANPPKAPPRAIAPASTGVHLDALNGDRPKPETGERNLFRFKSTAPPPPPPSAPRPELPTAPVVTAPTGPPPPPAVPPITLTFIGLMEAPTHGEPIAILSDGRNAPFYGKEGAIIEGRYRILKIGVESVELAYTDGRGRKTIRRTGS